MTTGSFDLKLERAREHLHAFEKEASAWIETKPYEIVHEPDPEPPPQPVNNAQRCHRIRISRFDGVPGRLSLIIGDCVFNLRSALDHLALALAMSNTPGITDTQISTSEFPVFHKIPKDQNQESRKIGCIAAPAIAVIKALQPYHGGSGYHADPLWQIHEFNRIDKHRMLTVCTGIPFVQGHFAVGFTNPANIDASQIAYVFGGGIREVVLNAVMLRYAAAPIDAAQDMHMEPILPLEIAFGNGGPAPLEAVVPTLAGLCDFVRDGVVAPLSKFL